MRMNQCSILYVFVYALIPFVSPKKRESVVIWLNGWLLMAMLTEPLFSLMTYMRLWIYTHQTNLSKPKRQTAWCQARSVPDQRWLADWRCLSVYLTVFFVILSFLVSICPGLYGLYVRFETLEFDLERRNAKKQFFDSPLPPHYDAILPLVSSPIYLFRMWLNRVRGEKTYVLPFLGWRVALNHLWTWIILPIIIIFVLTHVAYQFSGLYSWFQRFNTLDIAGPVRIRLTRRHQPVEQRASPIHEFYIYIDTYKV